VKKGIESLEQELKAIQQEKGDVIKNLLVIKMWSLGTPNMSVIQVFWRPRQEDHEFKANLDYIPNSRLSWARPYLKNNNKI
jgi:hypothetical protein